MWVRKPCWLTAGLVAPPNMPGSFQVFQLQELFVLPKVVSSPLDSQVM